MLWGSQPLLSVAAPCVGALSTGIFPSRDCRERLSDFLRRKVARLRLDYTYAGDSAAGVGTIRLT